MPILFPLTPFIPLPLPMMGSKIEAGFPSPADDHLEKCLDLNEYLIRHPAATFFLRVRGYSMIRAGIHHDDLLIVDRSLEPTSGDIVVAVLHGELTIKRLHRESGEVWLLPENPDFKPLAVTEGSDLLIWGVATDVVHSLKRR